mmetsp:Transcript_6473/g.20981  ORF Transcript_6473/g.20981 Transcript_6473/m.20981 type:complete len:256 (-) Transcript_6473:797-1564(-)
MEMRRGRSASLTRSRRHRPPLARSFPQALCPRPTFQLPVDPKTIACLLASCLASSLGTTWPACSPPVAPVPSSSPSLPLPKSPRNLSSLFQTSRGATTRASFAAPVPPSKRTRGTTPRRAPLRWTRCLLALKTCRLTHCSCCTRVATTRRALIRQRSSGRLCLTWSSAVASPSSLTRPTLASRPATWTRTPTPFGFLALPACPSLWHSRAPRTSPSTRTALAACTPTSRGTVPRLRNGEARLLPSFAPPSQTRQR